MGSGVMMPGHVLMMPDGGLRRSPAAPAAPADPRAIRATRGSPARSSSTAHDQPGRRSRDERHDRLALVGADLEQRDAVVGQRVGQPVEQPADDLEAVGAAVEGERGLERGRHRQAGHRVVPDVRQVGEDEVERRVGIGRQQVGLGERDPVRDRVADRVLAGEVERVGRDVDGQDLDRVEQP